MTNSNIVTAEDLKEAMNAPSVGYVESKLKEQGIRFFYGLKGSVWTTIDLINAAGGLSSISPEVYKTEDIL